MMEFVFVKNISLSKVGELIVLRDLKGKEKINGEERDKLYDVRVEKEGSPQFYMGLTKLEILERIKTDFKYPVIYIAHSDLPVPLSKYIGDVTER